MLVVVLGELLPVATVHGVVLGVEVAVLVCVAVLRALLLRVPQGKQLAHNLVLLLVGV